MSELVLVADADPFNLRLLSELCTTLGYEVVTAADGGAVLDAVARERPALVLMDAALPVMDGFSVLRILKADSGLRHVPILLVTGESDADGRERGLSLGADDYVTKPYRTREIQQRLRNVLRLSVVRERGHEASVDPVTHAGTASQLHISLDYELTRAVRYGHPLGCIVVCVATQEAPQLASVAAAIKAAIRNVDHLFRSGGSDLTVLLPETSADGTRIVVERLQALLADPCSYAPFAPPRLGVASACYPDESVTDGESLWRIARARATG